MAEIQCSTDDFIDYIRDGKLGEIISCITKGFDINADFESKSALYWAITFNQPTILKLLIYHKADVNKNVPLKSAVAVNSEEMVRDLLAAGATVDETILEVAAVENKFNIIKMLVDKVENIGDKKKFVRILLDNNSTDVLSYLHRIGMDINKKYDDMGSPLFHCASTGNYTMVSWLLYNGGAFTITSAFVRAIEKGRLDIVKTLRESGADVNFRYKSGQSPLILSLQLNQKDIALYLLDNGADPDFADKDGNRPLILAIQKNQPEIVKKLLKREVDTDISDKEGNSPLALALRMKQKENTKLLINVESSVKKDQLILLFNLIEQKNIEGVASLLEKKINLSAFNDSGFTPLTKSVDLGLVEIARILINKGAKVDQADKNGKTPLMIALSKYHFGLIDFLITSGSNIENCKKEMDKLSDADEDFACYLEKIRAKFNL